MRQRVRLLAAQAGLLGLSVMVLIVPASALFRDRYGADDLPFVYIAVAVLSGIGAAVLGRRPGSRAPFLGVLVVAAVDVALLVGSGSALR